MVGQFKVCLLTNYPFQPLVESLNLENPTIPHFNTDRVIHTEINLRYFFFQLDFGVPGQLGFLFSLSIPEEEIQTN